MINHRRLLHLEQEILNPGRGLAGLADHIREARERRARGEELERPEWMATNETIRERARQVREALELEGRY